MKIARAAIKFFELDNPNKERIYFGWNHAEIFQNMKNDGIIYDRTNYEMGFITNERPVHFVNRTEAAKIAFEAGQTKELHNELFSEDFWENGQFDYS